jgi:cellobiose phosphorylase
MAGIGIDDGKAEMALNAVKERLDCEYGIVLHNPAFTTYRLNMGEISTYPAGYKENAGIFCHNNPWIMIAETRMGNAGRAFEYYTKIAPSYLQHIQELHRVEPYVYAQMIAGKDALSPGEAKNSWLTGTAAWNFYAISQYILGLRPGYDGLYLEPCVPASLGDFTIQRRFRGKRLNIRVRQGGGELGLWLNGRRLQNRFLPLAEMTDENEVELRLP